MEITFLGTGAAWGLPEMACRCMVCETMRRLGEERTRTCLLVRTEETLLIDCGPDIRRQLAGRLLQPPHAVLLTHSHGDHCLGLDELVAFRRVLVREAWKPIPVYATAQTWERVEQVFGYLLNDLLEKRLARPGEPLEGLRTRVVPFATEHGPVAKGSVGYVVEGEGESPTRMLYTSDFMSVKERPQWEGDLHAAVIQSHWLHEPEVNRPHHMSFQRALDYIQQWRPLEVYLVHFSDEYPVEGDPFHKGLKAVAPLAPMLDPSTGAPYPQPLCHADWQDLVRRICRDMGLSQDPIVARDGLRVRVGRDGRDV
jgi:phosphoribosyl 1,2-cyclic phosphate phosphodiesterase